MREYIMRYENDVLQLLPDKIQPLVRCKDCKFRDETTEDCANVDSVCYRNGFTDGNWYCADGKRKDGGKE